MLSLNKLSPGKVSESSRKGMTVQPQSAEEWHRTEPWVRLGMRTCGALFIALIVFGAVISINGAVVATGTVTVENNYKTVQHLDGGVVAKIHVRNGAMVKAGDKLLTLDGTADRANMSIIRSRINEQLIQLARLEAERDGKTSFDIPGPVTPFMAEPRIVTIVATQRALFAARRQSRNGEHSVLNQRIEQLSAQLLGLKSQQESKSRELSLLREDLQAVRGLFKKGFANRQRLSTLERDAARLEGEVGRLSGDTANVNGALSEARLKRAQSDKEFTEKVVDELRQLEASLRELEENRVKIADKLSRCTVRAPADGLVHAMQVHTEGGVVEPAKPLLQIIPNGERLVIEARVPPEQIDKVHQGSIAGIRFPAFNARSTPRLDGKVTTISAAQLTNEKGAPYFTALIEISSAELAKIGAGHRLLPGMPAEVYIQTGSRSMLSYIVKPLIDSMFPAFRES